MPGHDRSATHCEVSTQMVDAGGNGVQTFLPRMLASGLPGHIVNVSSIGGIAALGSVGLYATSKFAVVGLTEALRTTIDLICSHTGWEVGHVYVRAVDDQRALVRFARDRAGVFVFARAAPGRGMRGRRAGREHHVL